MDNVPNICKCYYSTLYSEFFKVSTVVDFQDNVKKNEKQNEIHHILLVT
jgi:hypothetical protein